MGGAIKAGGVLHRWELAREVADHPRADREDLKKKLQWEVSLRHPGNTCMGRWCLTTRQGRNTVPVGHLWSSLFPTSRLYTDLTEHWKPGCGHSDFHQVFKLTARDQVPTKYTALGVRQPQNRQSTHLHGVCSLVGINMYAIHTKGVNNRMSEGGKRILLQMTARSGGEVLAVSGDGQVSFHRESS